MEQLVFIVLLVVLPCLVWGFPALFSRNRHEMTARATVQSHRVGRDSGWKYLVIFALADGETVELITTIPDYQSLEDGQSGQLTWEKGMFLHFDPDHPQ